MAAMEVIRPGMLTLIQDIGRYGAGAQGLSQGGAVDLHACCWANYLLANDPNSAMLEITLGQAEFLILQDCRIAMTGADMQPSLDGKLVPMWQSLLVKKGQRLVFGFARTGLRAYLAVQGGLESPLILDSASAVPRNHLGGFHQGMGLEKGDRLSAKPIPTGCLQHQGELAAGRQTSGRFVPDYSKPIELRVIESYQQASFSAEEKQRFYASRYTVSQETDRMGCRLSGEPIHATVDGIVSEGIALGAIQIPPNGQPIVLLNDRQTLGGYPKLGCVARVDLPRLAQARPGTAVTFKRAKLPEAVEQWQQFSRFFGLSL
ncbi:allophanate hydrolase [Photobacterium gaetbulicola]|uniref:Allophanate hydrolase subunit 2 n=1 Tax=Photobacterium gaetbulicola Gung47 TaxID=658445 RepID=A0A0C5WZ22_9GAMM|nr:biotin-dependent carboxyltransferase family protein [Photobacterium gaetbulicola]AJR08245.1 allophanate hydrolase subunit 2 [Photobacterium gaetbulicola Gung47]PSU09075.1 allophanate hydrolase [Photobacterium gaetbulicola]